MLKNKFGMLKVLALALSVLMLVSLAACGNSGVAKEDMDSAIAAALAEQSKAEASKQAALESSLAAAQAAAESERKAAESSLAAAAAEAEKKAEEASKAAASAEKKASEEASKAAASAAEASKAAASISASISKSQADAAKTSQSTTAPIVADKDAIAAVQAEFAKLRHEYTYTNEGLYLADNYAELTLLFDKAAVELQNALTKEAAESILATLKVEAAAIENVQNRADAVQALVAALGDIESELFTTQAEMIDAARKAYTTLKVDYDTYFGYDVDAKEDGANTVKKATKLGVNVADLEKAEAKLVVLEGYITKALHADMVALYAGSNYKVKFDADRASAGTIELVKDAYYKYLVLNTINGGDMAEADMPVDWDYALNEEGDKIKADADYKHPITGESLRYELANTEKNTIVTEYFTTEDLLDVFILPVLEKDFEAQKTAALDVLKDTLKAEKNYDEIAKAVEATLVDRDDIVDLYDDLYDEFEDELAAISFVDDYKGNATLADAVADLYARILVIYVDGVNAIIELSKEVAIDAYTENEYEVEIAKAEDKYGEREDAATLAALKAEIEADLEAYIANVNAVPTYDFDALNAAELRDLYSTKTDVIEELTEYIVDADDDDDEIVDSIATKFITYVNDVIIDAIDDNFDVVAGGSSSAVQTGDLLKLVRALVDDLKELRERLDPTEYVEGHLFTKATRGSIIAYLDGEKYFNFTDDDITNTDTSVTVTSYYYSNTPKFEAMVAEIDKAIADLQAVSVDNYTDATVGIILPDDEDQFEDYAEAKLYYIDATAKEYVEKNYPDVEDREAFLLANAKGTTVDGIKGKAINDDSKNSSFLTVSKTDYELTYVKTAAEQAQKAAYDIYAAAFNSIHGQLNGITNIVSKVQKELITNETNYKKILSNVSGSAELKAEVESFAALYTGYMATDAGKITNSVIKTKVWSDELQAYEITYGGWVASVGVTDELGADHVTCNSSELSNAENYALNGCEAKIRAHGATFKSRFFTDTTYSESTIVELWEYKTNAVKYITEALKGYKNTYTTKVGANGVSEPVQVPASNANAYVYDEDLTAPSLNGAAYEAAIDELINSYSSKIMGVKLQSRVEVRNHLAKNMNGGSNDNRLLSKVSDKAWTINSARAIVNAYVVDVLGYYAVENYKVAEKTAAVVDNPETTDVDETAAATYYYYTDGVKKLYSSTTLDDVNVDSRVYAAYKAKFLNKYDAIKLTMA